MKAEIRPATRYDINEWYGTDYKRSCRAWVIEYDGKPAAIGGYSFEDAFTMVFSTERDHGAPKMTIWRQSTIIVDRIKALGIPLVAIANPEIAGSRRFLERQGFQFYRSSEGGDILIWQTP